MLDCLIGLQNNHAKPRRGTKPMISLKNQLVDDGGLILWFHQLPNCRITYQRLLVGQKTMFLSARLVIASHMENNAPCLSLRPEPMHG